MQLAMREVVKKHWDLCSFAVQLELIRKYFRIHGKEHKMQNRWFQFLAEEFDLKSGTSLTREPYTEH